jgi:hypothetical protein
VVDPPRPDSPLDVPRKLSAENPILRSDRRRRRKEKHAEPHNVGKKPKIARNTGHMCASCQIQLMIAGAVSRQPHVVNYCGPQFRDYYNEFRVHSSLDGTTPAQRAGKQQRGSAALSSYVWRQHCHGLFQTPMVA